MYINIKDEKKINDVLSKVQKGYRVRLVSYDDIKKLVMKDDEKLKTFQCDYEGCFFKFVEYVKCNYYSKKAFNAYSTYISVRRGYLGWVLYYHQEKMNMVKKCG
jgi:hypothetical protein